MSGKEWRIARHLLPLAGGVAQRSSRPRRSFSRFILSLPKGREKVVAEQPDEGCREAIDAIYGAA
ncbi:MAG: hypothetical protein M3453_07945 [Pseudomonadota bacterium]|nr:hypothetical protein [Pseudomonadota bacterium]